MRNIKEDKLDLKAKSKREVVFLFETWTIFKASFTQLKCVAIRMKTRFITSFLIFPFNKLHQGLVFNVDSHKNYSFWEITAATL